MSSDVAAAVSDREGRRCETPRGRSPGRRETSCTLGASFVPHVNGGVLAVTSASDATCAPGSLGASCVNGCVVRQWVRQWVRRASLGASMGGVPAATSTSDASAPGSLMQDNAPDAMRSSVRCGDQSAQHALTCKDATRDAMQRAPG